MSDVVLLIVVVGAHGPGVGRPDKKPRDAAAYAGAAGRGLQGMDVLSWPGRRPQAVAGGQAGEGPARQLGPRRGSGAVRAAVRRATVATPKNFCGACPAYQAPGADQAQPHRPAAAFGVPLQEPCGAAASYAPAEPAAASAGRLMVPTNLSTSYMPILSRPSSSNFWSIVSNSFSSSTCSLTNHCRNANVA